MNSASGTKSGSEKEHTEFLAGALVGVDEMKRFGVGVTHHVLEIGAHIHELLGGGGGGGGVKINCECLSLNVDGNVGSKVVKSNFVAIAHHNSKGICGLSTKAQRTNEALLH